MSLFEKDEAGSAGISDSAGTEEEIDVSVGTAADVENVMKEFDRESNVRNWEGIPKKIIRYLTVAFSLYAIYETLFGTTLPETKLSIFVSFILLIGYLTYPVKKGYNKVNYMPWYDIVIMAVGTGAFLFYAINAHAIIRMATRVTRDPAYLVIGIIGVLSLMELCRRCVGIPILCVAGALIAYTFSSGVSLRTVVYTLFYTTSGVMSTPINVCSKYIVVFIIFGAFLERTGVAEFFINIANSIAGAAAGGPAKVAVIASALEGMVSGSSVANTVGSGSFTIPMMKRIGYPAEFAGAVEAAASTGGQIMPPVMGAAAFLMAEYMGVTYAEVAMRAVLPAFLYFAGIFIAVHLEAKKLGLKGMPRDQIPKLRKLLPKSYLLAPLFVLVGLVGSNTRTMQFSAAVSIVVAIVVSMFNKDNRLTFEKFFDALEAGGKSTVTVAVACGVAGIIAGCITATGLASKLISAIVAISGDVTFVALILTMLCCIVLGMGVPTTANYCIMASTCAPILIAMGFPKMSAHFFVFYFGIIADITPPVALAAYAGAAIAKGNPMKTGVTATKLAVAAFVVPYIFAYSPSMLFIDTNAFDVVQICITALIGIFGVAAALNGFLYRKLNVVFRLLLLVGGLCMLDPGTFTDIIGAVIVGGVLAFQYLNREKPIPA